MLVNVNTYITLDVYFTHTISIYNITIYISILYSLLFCTGVVHRTLNSKDCVRTPIGRTSGRQFVSIGDVPSTSDNGTVINDCFTIVLFMSAWNVLNQPLLLRKSSPHDIMDIFHLKFYVYFQIYEVCYKKIIFRRLSLISIHDSLLRN